MRNHRALLLFTVGFVLLFSLLLGVANLWFGDLNQDEGWYLYAARMFWNGRMPYRDFFFTQSPLLPVVYGVLYPVWSIWGVAGGRLLTLLLGLVASLVTAWAAARVAPKAFRLHAAITAFALLACNTYHSYFTTVVKTYGLASLFVAGSVLALSKVDGRHPNRAAALCGVFLACATGTRLSLGIGLCVVGGYLLGRRKNMGQEWAWFWFGIGGVAALGVIFIPFVIPAFEGYRFAVSFHTERLGGGINPLYLAGFAARWLGSYLIGFALGAGLVARALLGRKRMPEQRYVLGWLVVGVMMTVVHALSPYPYDDYQVPVMPYFAAALSVALWHRLSGKLTATAGFVWILAGLFVLGVSAASSPLTQSWVMLRQDRFWVVQREESALSRLRKVGAWVEANVPDGETVLTQDLYIAVEADRDVPQGLEMGPFCYFPALDEEKARAVSVMNRDMMRRLLLTGDSPIALFSGYGLAVAAPEMVRVDAEERGHLFQDLMSAYQSIGSVKDFGQGATVLYAFAFPRKIPALSPWPYGKEDLPHEPEQGSAVDD